MGLIFLDDDYATHNVPGVSSVGASFLQRGCVFCTSSKELAKGCGRGRKNSSKFSFIDKKKIKIKHSTSSQNEFFILEYPYSVTLF